MVLTLGHRKIDHKYLESFEMWCCRRIEKISWNDHVRNEEVLLTVKEEINILTYLLTYSMEQSPS